MTFTKQTLTILAAFMIGFSGLAASSGKPQFVSNAEAQVFNPNPRPLPPQAPPKLKEVCTAINQSGCTKMVVTPLPGDKEALCTLYDKNGNCMKNAIMPLDPRVSPMALQPYLKPEIMIRPPYDPLKPRKN